MEIKNYFAQDAQGNIMPSANCYLYLPGTTTLATGLVDGNGAPISNPFLASGMGQITFGAPNGVYDLRVALGARDWTIKVQCADIVQAMDVVDSILGSHAENPTTRNNGQPLEPGDETWNSSDKQPYWWNGTAWVALNSSAQQLEERLASPSGTTHVGKDGETLEVYLDGQQHLARSTAYPSPVVPLPKYRVLGTTADGSGMQSFPSVARYKGVDFVFFRSGNGHTGDDGVIKLHRVSQETGVLIDTTLILDLTYDTRDPCVLTDHNGEAVLVGGKMKIVVFHTLAGTANSVSVYDLDPTNISAGMTNRVNVPGEAIAIRSDVKKMDDGTYGFVTYSLEKLFYVKTTDFVTFTSELINQNGNEAALAEESDGTIVVVARASINDEAIVYKKSPGGAWRVAFNLPLRLNAPSIRRLPYTVSNDANAVAGWLLIARDNRDGFGISSYDTGNTRLIAMISRNASGLKIDTFDIIQDIMGLPQVSSTRLPYGDAFYASAVTSKYGNGVDIYTHAPIYDDVFQTPSSYGVKIIRLSGKFNPGNGLYFEPASISNPKNLVVNGDFNSDLHWFIPPTVSISQSNALFSGATGYIEQIINLVPGVQYRLMMRARRVSGNGNATNQHIQALVRDATVGVTKTILNMRGTAAKFGDDFHVMRSQPFQVDTASTFVVRVLTYADVTVDTVSKVDWVYVGQASDLIDFVDSTNVDVPISATGSAPATVSGGVLSVGYSSTFWSLFFGMTRLGGRPIGFASPESLRNSLRIVSATDGAGRPLMLKSFIINSDYSVTVKAELFPSDVALGLIPASPWNFSAIVTGSSAPNQDLLPAATEATVSLEYSTSLFREMFAGATLPDGWTEAGGWTVSDGLVSPASGGWGCYAVSPGYSSLSKRRICAKVRVDDPVSVFGLCTFPPASSGGAVALVDGAAKTLKLYSWNGTATAGSASSSVAIPFNLVAGRNYTLEVIKDALKSTIVLTDTVTQVSCRVSETQSPAYAQWHGRAGVMFHSGAIKVDWLGVTAGYPKKAHALVIGDSICEGNYLPLGSPSWAYQVADLRKGEGDFAVAPRAGDTTPNFMLRKVYDLDPWDAQYVVLALGTNDGTQAAWRTNIASLISQIVAAGGEPILCTQVPRDSSQPVRTAMNADIRSGYFGRYRYIDFAICVSQNNDGVTWDAAYAQPDRIHPNSAGQLKMFNQAMLDAPFLAN